MNVARHVRASVFGATILVKVRIAASFVSLFSRPVPSPIHRHLPINRHRHESVGSAVLELDDLMSLSCQSPPVAGLLGILLDGLILPPVHAESQRF